MWTCYLSILHSSHSLAVKTALFSWISFMIMSSRSSLLISMFVFDTLRTRSGCTQIAPPLATGLDVTLCCGWVVPSVSMSVFGVLDTSRWRHYNLSKLSCHSITAEKAWILMQVYENKSYHKLRTNVNVPKRLSVAHQVEASLQSSQLMYKQIHYLGYDYLCTL